MNVAIINFVVQSTLPREVNHTESFGMNQIDDPARDLSEIRSMMERSSKFLSLSGMAGVSAGCAALAGAAAAWWRLGRAGGGEGTPGPAGFLAADAVVVLFLALGLAVFFTTRRARTDGIAVWSGTTKRLLLALLVPLSAGGIFSLLLWYHGLVMLVPPVTLIFYGLALFNSARYTVPEVQYLASGEILLGLASALYLDSWLPFWAAGFGVLHIAYGTALYLKYEK